MRVIKFRAWDEGNEVMHKDFQFIKSGDEGKDWIIFISDKYPLTNHETNPFTNPNPYFAQQLKIMQYTGLKDKNGVEIYEGDIVKNVFAENTTSKIFYDTPTASFKGHIVDNKYLSERLDYRPSDLYFVNKYEIIGNIYENPELLE